MIIPLAFTVACPGCGTYLEIPPGHTVVPAHPFKRERVAVYPYAAKSPALGSVTLVRNCKWGGAAIVAPTREGQ